MKMTWLDRLLLTAAGLLAAYQIVVGIDKLSTIPILAYTIAFGVLLIAVLLLVILGFDVLDSPLVVITATVIPLSLATGLVWEHLADYRFFYLAFSVLGLLAVVVTRSFPMPGRLPTVVLAIIHGLAGLTIFLLPIYLSVQGATGQYFALVGLGGGLIGLGGLFLSFLKAGKPFLSREYVYKLLPILLFIMTACYVAGFKLG
jgi:hypothetical protein